MGPLACTRSKPLQISPPSSLVQLLQTRERIQEQAYFAPLHGGRTNQVWRILGQQEDLVLKLYRNSPANPLFRNDPEREIHCLRKLADTGFVPRLRDSGESDGSHWVLYDHAPGATWQQDPVPAAQVLRQWHDTDVSLDLPSGCNGSVEIAAHAQSILKQCKSNDRDTLLALRPNGIVPPIPNPRPIHGDPVAGNILCQDGSAILIDWQCPVIGDPCEDLALFLSPAMQMLYRGQVLTAKEIETFHDAYAQPTVTKRLTLLMPWYHWRMSAYCLWRAENGAREYAQAMTLELPCLQNTQA